MIDATTEMIEDALKTLYKNKEATIKKIEELENELKCRYKNIIRLGEYYYFICPNNTVVNFKHIGSDFDKEAAKYHNIYRNESDITEWIKANELQHRYSKLCEQFSVDWDSINPKYFLYYDSHTKNLKIGSVIKHKAQGTFYCSDIDALKRFIEQEGEGNIIKYICEIGLPEKCQLEDNE